MKLNFLFIFAVFGIIILTLSNAAPPLISRAARPQAVQAPVLKWQHGGCYSSWCETGWYASPAVADLDGDGSMEVIAGAYTIFILDGANGSVLDSIDTPGSRVWPGVVVADLDGDEDWEIVTAQGSSLLPCVVFVTPDSDELDIVHDGVS